LFLTPDASTSTSQQLLLFAITTSSTPEPLRLDWTNSLPLNVTSFVAVTYSPVRGVTKLYLNGVPVSSGIANIPLSGIIDTNNWLGRSQYSFDSYFGGRYNEFRIYSGLLSDSDVAADYAAGPDVVGVDYVLHDYSSTNSMTVTWGLTATNWYLQSSPTLGPGAVWTPVLIPAIANGRYSVTVPFSSDAAFFRLHAP
jgi:Concanavalin A-like lectin/glucanases superfamily